MKWWQRPQVAVLIQRYQALNPRERQLSLITLHFVLLALMAVVFIEPLASRGMAQQSQANELLATNARLEQQLQQLQNSPIKDPNQDLRDELELLTTERLSIESRISNLTDALVSPDKMVAVLEQMLTQDSRLKITSLVTLPKEEIQLDANDPSARLYRHGLRLRIRATYDSLVDYLKRLDALQWRLYWQSLDYRVEQYPRGELLLEVYTLSSREDVVGA
jgi:MSHA biogenesis protein MshJ